MIFKKINGGWACDRDLTNKQKKKINIINKN